MESQLIRISVFLEELKMKRNQVGQLDSELSCMSLHLIQKESELSAKTAYCNQLEFKLAQSQKDVKNIEEDYCARLKAHQLESGRQEAAILDYAEKLRKSTMEKQCLALKIAHFDKEIKEVYGHVLAASDSLPKLNNEQENLSESIKNLENKQNKVVETCEMIQIFAGRIQKEAEGKWKMAQESRNNRSELEKKLCAAEAQLRAGEGGRGKEDTNNGLLRKQIDSLNNQLEMSKTREDKLRMDLGREREEKLVLQRKHEEVLNELAHYLSEQKEQRISPA